MSQDAELASILSPDGEVIHFLASPERTACNINYDEMVRLYGEVTPISVWPSIVVTCPKCREYLDHV